MPYAVDEEALNSPNLKILDIHNPPMKQIPFYEYPKAVFLHPVDKTKEHRVIEVQDKAQEAAALRKGYKLKPHVPIKPPDPAIEAGEYEIA